MTLAVVCGFSCQTTRYLEVAAVDEMREAARMAPMIRSDFMTYR